MKKTTDYESFKTVHGNREIHPRHVEDLVAAIRKKNLLEYFPLLVNEHMQVIDGQHRLEAANILGIPIWYVQIPGLTLEDVMSINSSSRSWTALDFVNAYIMNGNRDYQVLLDFAKKYGVGIQLAARLLYGDRRGHMESISKIVKKGLFEVRQLEVAERSMDMVAQVKPYCDFNPLTDRNFMLALQTATKSPNFDFEQFISKLKVHGLTIESRAQVRYYVLEIEDLFNFKSKKRVDIYASAQTTPGARLDDVVL